MADRRLTASMITLFFFFNDTATTEIYTLSLHDALPISRLAHLERGGAEWNDLERAGRSWGERRSERNRLGGGRGPDVGKHDLHRCLLRRAGLYVLWRVFPATAPRHAPGPPVAPRRPPLH